LLVKSGYRRLGQQLYSGVFYKYIKGEKFYIMTLPFSGPMSLSMVQTEYGGSNPISMSEYYKLGTYVPQYITDYDPGPTSSNELYNASYYWNTAFWGVGVYNEKDLVWGGTLITTTFWTTTSYTVSGWTYYRGAFQTSAVMGTTNVSGVNQNIDRYRYAARRDRQLEVNIYVPTSGATSLSGFYGGRKA